jgi:hypothetical protein
LPQPNEILSAKADGLKRTAVLGHGISARMSGVNREQVFMASSWARFNEYEDVLASTDLLALVIPKLAKNPSHWKWTILASHSGLQGALVCAVQDSTKTAVLTNRSARETLDWLETPEGDEPDQRLLEWPKLLRKFRKKYPCAAMTVPQLKDMKRLHEEFRNNFTHFIPRGWSIEIAGLPRIIATAVDLIELAMQQHQVTVNLSGNMKRRLTRNLEDARLGLSRV